MEPPIALKNLHQLENFKHFTKEFQALERMQIADTKTLEINFLTLSKLSKMNKQKLLKKLQLLNTKEKNSILTSVNNVQEHRSKFQLPKNQLIFKITGLIISIMTLIQEKLYLNLQVIFQREKKIYLSSKKNSLEMLRYLLILCQLKFLKLQKVSKLQVQYSPNINQQTMREVKFLVILIKTHPLNLNKLSKMIF